MKVFLILTFSLLFAISVFGQEITQTEVDTIIKGSWKCDSNTDIIKFDCAGNNQIYGYGLIDQKHKDWFIIFKYCDVCKGNKCADLKNGTGFYLKEFYSSDPRMIPRELYCYAINKISKDHLTLYMECGSHPCQVFTYSRIDETAPVKKKKKGRK